MSARREQQISPGLLGSIALHGAVAALIAFGLPWKSQKPITIGESVPVTIVKHAEVLEGVDSDAVEDAEA